MTASVASADDLLPAMMWLLLHGPAPHTLPSTLDAIERWCIGGVGRRKGLSPRRGEVGLGAYALVTIRSALMFLTDSEGTSH